MTEKQDRLLTQSVDMNVNFLGRTADRLGEFLEEVPDAQ